MTGLRAEIEQFAKDCRASESEWTDAAGFERTPQGNAYCTAQAIVYGGVANRLERALRETEEGRL